MRVRLTKEIVHRDMNGAPLGRWPVGHVVEATADRGHYWVAFPAVYKDEGTPLPEEIDDRHVCLGYD